ncbi:ABC transporter ATP-binding protein [Evansella sp. AB-rgal1]|uniref:ABC transporter ATP-binding protein n=1 Tax=Evansella sp. AB-rgal1 TaxID=3242696 RepID=UPI00359D8A9B
MREYVVETTNLTKEFKSTIAVKDVDLRIPKGAIYGFLGPNGAGKTTAIKLLLGLIQETNGSISIFGEDLKKARIKILQKVGALVEAPSYYDHLTARENLEILRVLLQVPKNKIDEVLSIVKLEKDANRAVKSYSLGMKQRLGIAAALIGNPELLILDEPTNGLDPSGIIEIRELIKTLPRQYGITVLVSSHLLSEVDQMATEVGIISKGSLIFQDSIEILRKKSVSRIMIRTNHNEFAQKILACQDCNVNMEGEYITFPSNEDKEISKIIKNLIAKNVDIYRVEEAKSSLESIFLEMTKEDNSL